MLLLDEVKGSGVHAGLEDGEAAFAGFLGRVHGDVRVAQHLPDITDPRRGYRDPHTRTDGDGRPWHLDRAGSAKLRRGDIDGREGLRNSGHVPVARGR